MGKCELGAGWGAGGNTGKGREEETKKRERRAETNNTGANVEKKIRWRTLNANCTEESVG